MTLKKHDRFLATYNGRVYELVGRWNGEYVLAPRETDAEECLIYTHGDMEELLESGELVKEGC